MAAEDRPPLSYGTLIETTARILTWNVWGRHGRWTDREPSIIATLQEARPDVVVLTEAWATDDDSQCVRLAEPLGLPHHVFTGVPAEEDAAALSGIGILSRWPIRSGSSRTYGAARVQQAEIAGPRGPLQVWGVGLDAWWLDESRARQDAVRDLLVDIGATQDARTPLVLCGDFNADPDSDEIRLLTGRAAAPAPGLSFYDAWEVAGSGPGHTWSNANPEAQRLLWPDRRIDYVFSAAPRTGGAGHPLHAGLVGTGPVGGVQPSDHYAVLADLRY